MIEFRKAACLEVLLFKSGLFSSTETKYVLLAYFLHCTAMKTTEPLYRLLLNLSEVVVFNDRLRESSQS